GLAKSYRFDELQIVSGGMVFGVLLVGRTHQTTHCQVEAGRAILPLVTAVRSKGPHLILTARQSQTMLHRPIDRAVSSPTALVGEFSRISNARKHQSMLDPGNNNFIH